MKFDNVFEVANNSQTFHSLSTIFNQLRSHIKSFITELDPLVTFASFAYTGI